jgi:nicotinate phosphoribosyltransferase
MSFKSEEEAFEAYAGLYPDKAIFLIDTYDTLKSGIRNAIKAGHKLAERGNNFGIRLDSGDIHYLSSEVRRQLDEAGLKKAFIAVSNDLDEHIIETLVKEGAPVDSWGVGTRLITGCNTAAFTGVYKMAAILGTSDFEPVMKFSDNPEKTTNPGVKQVWRIKDKNGAAIADVLSIDDDTDIPKEGGQYRFWHPSADYRHFLHTVEGAVEPLLKKHINCGVITGIQPSLAEIKEHVEKNLESFDSTYKRLLNPHVYKVSITDKLRDLKLELIQKHLGNREN